MLPQLFLWCWPAGDFLFPSVLVHLLVVILWGRAVLSPSFILLNYLLVWTHSYFLILGVIVQHCYYFVVQIVPPLATGSSFTLASVIWHDPSFSEHLTVWCHKWFVLCFPCPSSKAYHFSKQPWFLLSAKGSDAKIWVPMCLLLLRCHLLLGFLLLKVFIMNGVEFFHIIFCIYWDDQLFFSFNMMNDIIFKHLTNLDF